MKKMNLISACLLLSISCMQHVNANTISMHNDTAINNQLTQKEKAEGWKLLYDGNSLNGWRTYKNLPGSWKTENGMICTKSADDGHADLITDSMFENFELSVDWKISPEGNSGILYLATEDYDQTYLSGPEYQLIDDDGFPEHIEEWQKTGASYAIQAPAVKAAHKPGEWNTTKIIVNKSHVEHWLNGKKVVDYTIGSEAWNKAKNEGKWKEASGYGAAKKGHIAFQSSHSKVETSGVCFRNVKIKLL